MNKILYMLAFLIIYLLTFVMAISWNEMTLMYRISFNAGIIVIMFFLSSHIIKCSQKEQTGLNNQAIRYFKSKVSGLNGVTDIYSDHYDSADFVTVTLEKDDSELKQKICDIHLGMHKIFSKFFFDVGFRYKKWT